MFKSKPVLFNNSNDRSKETDQNKPPLIVTSVLFSVNLQNADQHEYYFPKGVDRVIIEGYLMKFGKNRNCSNPWQVNR